MDFGQDQRMIWTSPAHIHVSDGAWLVPLGGIAAGLFATDSSYSASLSQNTSTISHYKTVSNAGIAGLAGAGAGMYLFSFPLHNDHWRETGFLSGEAALNSLIVVEAMKYSLGRQRPYQDHGNGDFFQKGTSFPSEHAAAAWSIAAIMAHEYPGFLPKLFAYGTASLVDFSRVHARQHFPSDVLIGSVLGYLIAQSVYSRRHEPEVGGGAWEPPREFVADKSNRDPGFMGSPYVPLDSWVYATIERLFALGYVHSAYLDMRPWTRLECARIVQEAGQEIQERGDDVAAVKLLEPLTAEFAQETLYLKGDSNIAAQVESVYTRITGISGRPQVDGYHFGQTLINDYGRPYGEGLNVISGASAYATLGTLAFYVRGEYQRAPGISSDPLSVQQAIANADQTLPVPNGRPELNQFRLIDAYMSVTLNNTQFSFGRQSLWLAPGESGALLFSNNAESVPMFKISSVSPFRIPLLSRLLGPAQSEYFLGQLSGHQFEYNLTDSILVGPGGVKPQPFIQGVKLNFKPTANFEFGAGFTALFSGPGLPFTFHNYIRSIFSHTSGTNNPAKRTTSFDFTYRVPGLRKWLTIYSDFMAVDEYSPIGSSRATVNPGIYMPQIPKIPRLELRAEGLHEPTTTEFAPGFVYYGVRRYRDGYTNDGNILGSWIGRAGLGGQGWLTYSFSPRNKFQFGYRHQEVSSALIGGGRLIDYSLKADILAGRNAALSGYLQFEQWRFPVINPNRQSNVTASIQLTFYPHVRARN
jgi:membrane-associated phospholipid phosphatase